MTLESIKEFSLSLMKSDLIRGNIAASVMLVVLIGVLRMMLVRSILKRTEAMRADDRRRILVNTRNGVVLLVLVGLVLIWARELQAFAVSVVVLASAIVVATKELIMCLSGALMRMVTKPFKVGDRIEIGVIRGDVVDMDMFVTKLLEIGPGVVSHQRTGRLLTIPNSALLTSTIINETELQDYIIHAIPVTLKVEDDWRRAEKVLLEAAGAEMADFHEEMQSQIVRLVREQGFDAPTSDPHVILNLDESGEIKLVLRCPVPARRKGRVTDRVLRRFLDEFHRPAAASG